MTLAYLTCWEEIETRLRDLLRDAPEPSAVSEMIAVLRDYRQALPTIDAQTPLQRAIDDQVLRTVRVCLEVERNGFMKNKLRSPEQLADEIDVCLRRWHVITQYSEQILDERKEILACLMGVRARRTAKEGKGMTRKDQETLWLCFAMASEAAGCRDFDGALSYSQKAMDMITQAAARKKQSQMAVDAIAYRDFRKSS